MIWLMVNIKIWVKVLRDKAFEIASNPKYDGYQRRSTPMVSKFCNKKSTDSGINSISISNQQLANELHKPIIRIFKRMKVYSSFQDNFFFWVGWGGRDLADMQLIS